MSFDEVQLPLRVGFGSGGGPEFSTEIVTIESGYERRNQNWSQARRRYDAATGLRSAADAATLLRFFHARAGRARGFRLKDWVDFTSKADGTSAPGFGDQLLGTGNGTNTSFTLIKNYTSGSVTHARFITKPVTGSVVVGLNGTAQASGWSVNTTSGLVSFSSPPGSGVSVTAGFEFDVPVRFERDQLSVSTENFALQNAQVPLIEIRV